MISRWTAALCAALALHAVCAVTHAGPQGAQGSTLGQRFTAGNEAYHRGDYREARRHYEHILRYGVASPDVEYNLGNALLKAGEIGEAILHYERCLVLEPRAEDARHNLEVAGTRLANGAVVELVQRGIEVGEGSEADWVALFRALRPVEAGLLLLLLVWLALGLLLIRRLLRLGDTARTLVGWGGGVALALALLAGGYVGGQLWIADNVRLGVMLEGAPVREGPSEAAPALFRAPEGLRVRLLPSPVPQWRAVRVNSELRGFVEASAAAPISERRAAAGTPASALERPGQTQP